MQRFNRIYCQLSYNYSCLICQYTKNHWITILEKNIVKRQQIQKLMTKENRTLFLKPFQNPLYYFTHIIYHTICITMHLIIFLRQITYLSNYLKKEKSLKKLKNPISYVTKGSNFKNKNNLWNKQYKNKIQVVLNVFNLPRKY